MTHIQSSIAMSEERSALVDRIRFYESGARHFNEDWRIRKVNDLDGHIANAKARLERLDNMIAGLGQLVDA
jgi:hypothetical protein